jgi:peroxiredoxin
LFDLAGAPVKLGDLWAQGPLVVLFHPGSSDSCALQLRKWKELEDALLQLGAKVAVVCLQDPDGPLQTSAATSSPVEVLRDTNMYAAYGFGVAVPLLPEVVDLCKSIGADASVLGGTGRSVLATPATYLIEQDGRIVFADLAADLGSVEPEDVVAMIHALRPRMPSDGDVRSHCS